MHGISRVFCFAIVQGVVQAVLGVSTGEDGSLIVRRGLIERVSNPYVARVIPIGIWDPHIGFHTIVGRYRGDGTYDCLVIDRVLDAGDARRYRVHVRGWESLAAGAVSVQPVLKPWCNLRRLSSRT